MLENERGSARALIRSLVRDARELVQDEIALARAEIQENVATGKRIGIAFGAAALLALSGAVLIFTAVANGMADLFEIPAWMAYGVMALVLAAGAWVLMSLGKSRVTAIGVLPKTRASLRENMEWIRSKSNGK